MENNDVVEAIYPCRFPVKVIGETGNELEKAIIDVMKSLGEAIGPAEMTKTHSRNKKYVSITFKVVATSREYVDRMYSELNARKEVKMVL